MKNKLYTLFVSNILMCFLFSYSLYAQNLKCGTTEYMNAQINQNSNWNIVINSLNNELNHYLQKQSNTNYIIEIPVVIHLIYHNNEENLSDDIINIQMTELNNCFANSNIHFHLATKDPNGNATTGIERKYSQNSNWQADNNVKYASSGGYNAWNRDKYLNIWVCNIDLFGKIFSFAQFPSYKGIPDWENFGKETDGVVISYAIFGQYNNITDYFDSSLVSNLQELDEGKTLVHEVGHWLGLLHTWGDVDDCSGTDFVDDTPPCSGPCWAITADNAPIQCNGQRRQVENYMDYSMDEVKTLFTAGQSSRMRDVIRIARYTFLPVTAIVDQQLEDGTSIGDIGWWDGENFDNLRMQPKAHIHTMIGATEVFQAVQSIVQDEKYFNWTKDLYQASNNLNHHQFDIDQDGLNFAAHLKQCYEGVVIKNICPEIPSFNLSNTTVGFSDPWLIDYADPNYNNIKRNQDASAPFISRNSPFTPDFNTNYNGSVYAGVFLNLNNPLSWSFPYYSVSSPAYQTVNINGVIHALSFQNWSGSNVYIKDLTSNSTPVSFTTASAVLNANLKVSELSNSQTGFINNNQNKYVVAPDGIRYHIYTSMNKIWLENKAGNAWGILNNGKPLNLWDASEPAVDYLTGNSKAPLLITAHTENIDDYDETDLVVNLISYTIIKNRFEYGFEDCKISSPVIATLNDSRFLVVAKLESPEIPIGLYGWYFKVVNNALTLVNDEPFFISSTDVNSCSPAIAVIKQFNAANNFQLAYTENYPSSSTSKIMYKVISINQNDAISQNTPVSISDGSGFTKNYSPSLIATTDGARVVWSGQRVVDPDGLEKVNDTYTYETKIVFKDPSYYRYWSFGNNVNTSNINKSNDNLGYIFAWSESDGAYTDKYADNNLSIIRTLTNAGGANLTGKDVQICNADTKSLMNAISFQSSTAPYLFNESGTILSKDNTAITNIEGREGVIYKNNAQFYFSLSDLREGENKIKFINIPDDISLNTLEKLNSYLITEPFTLDNNSSFYYSVQCGVTDSTSAKNIFDRNDDYINFKIQLIDNNTNEVIGNYDNVTFNKDNYKKYRKVEYKVNADGIGDKTVRLRLTINDNIDLNYSITKSINEFTNIEKNNIKEISYSGASTVKEFSLIQNYPNPFNPSTTIKYQIPVSELVTIKVYDILGREIKTLVDEIKMPGIYSVNFDGSALSSGVYIYTIKAGEFISSKKMTLIK